MWLFQTCVYKVESSVSTLGKPAIVLIFLGLEDTFNCNHVAEDGGRQREKITHNLILLT